MKHLARCAVVAMILMLAIRSAAAGIGVAVARASDASADAINFRLVYQDQNGESFGDQEQIGTSVEEESSTTPGFESGQWTFELAPYLWMAGVRSRSSLGPFDIDADVDFTDLVSMMDMGGMLRFEAMNGRWGLFFDGLYMSLSEDGTVELDKIRFGLRADVRSRVMLLKLGGFYRFGEPDLAFDAILGGQYVYTRLDLDVGPFGTSRSNSVWDPIVGGRLLAALSENWRLSLKGTIGGFGVGTDLTWDATAMLRYRLSQRTTLGFGYRYLKIEQDAGLLDMDVAFHGPIVGISFRF